MTRTSTDDDTLLVTTDEAARLLSVSPWMIRSLMSSGAIAKIKIGRSVRVRRSDIERLANTKEPW
jgi:excisionase family DNA binding protein